VMDSNRSPWRQGPLVTLLLLVAAGLAEAQPMAYMASTSAGLVTAIDTLTNTPVGTIPVGVSPTRVAVSGDGTKAYVANSASVSVIDTASDAVVATIGLGGNPSALAVTPDEVRLYVLLAERSRVGGTLSGKVRARRHRRRPELRAHVRRPQSEDQDGSPRHPSAGGGLPTGSLPPHPSAQGIEEQRRGAVAPGPAKLIQELPTRALRESLQGQGRAQNVAADPLQLIPPPRRHRHSPLPSSRRP
jgi:YVTN family beta-propeller protein